MPSLGRSGVTLSDAEVLELYRYFRFTYVSPNTQPALSRLLARVDQRAAELSAETPERSQVCHPGL